MIYLKKCIAFSVSDFFPQPFRFLPPLQASIFSAFAEPLRLQASAPHLLLYLFAFCIPIRLCLCFLSMLLIPSSIERAINPPSFILFIWLFSILTLSLIAAAFSNSIFFLFQAEDGIRDWSVTGVQTCALPISHACPPKDEFQDGKARSGNAW